MKQRAAQDRVVFEPENGSLQLRMLLEERALQSLVFDLRLVEGCDPVQGALDDDQAEVLEQLRHVLPPNLVLGCGDQIPQDPKAPREVGGLLDQVQQHRVEQEALATSRRPVLRPHVAEGVGSTPRTGSG